MIAPCKLTPAAEAVIRGMLGFETAAPVVSAEIEFREVPYFLVARSREKWSAEQGDINEVQVIAANEFGLVINPDNRPTGGDLPQAPRHTLVPWQNILSLSLGRDAGGQGAS